MRPALATGQRRALPLAITAGVHLLLAGLWMATSPRPPAAGDTQPAMRLLWLRPAAPPPRPEVPPKERKREHVATPPRTAAMTAPAPVQPPEAATPAEPTPEPAPAPVPRASAAELLAGARMSAGAIDRELRSDKRAPLQGNGAWNRFEAKVAEAKVNHARSVSTETYVSPDGTVTYRTRNGGKVYCRRSGGVAPGLEPTQGALLASGGPVGGLRTAGSVRCPSQEPGFRP